MTNKKEQFIRLWGMPIWMAAITFTGLTLAILGTGIWHILSWLALLLPVYIMVKYGRKFFRKKSV